jgi:hypothetical protein
LVSGCEVAVIALYVRHPVAAAGIAGFSMSEVLTLLGTKSDRQEDEGSGARKGNGSSAGLTD